MPSDRESSSNSSGRNGTTTRVITRRPATALQTLNPDVVATQKHEEWTTSKKVVNHKTKQVETRVQRQIILEDGKVVADSGPQVTTKTTEDNKVEESENTEHKTTGDDDKLNPNYVRIPGSAKVVSEKTETHQVMKESKEENMQLHDENVQELNGPEIHRKSLVLAPNESPFYSLDTLKQLPGKMTHYSSKSKKITDKEEVKETSELKNGEVVTETTRTHHHEEVHDDEVPEDEANQALPSATETTPKRLTYNYDDEFESLSDKIRKEKELNIIRDIAAERRDPVTRKALSVEEEEEIRNSETNRWLDNHFGSDESDVAEPTIRKSKSGGNVINIRMSSTTTKPVLERENVHKTSFSRISTNNTNTNTNSRDEVDNSSRLFKSTYTTPIGNRFSGTRDSPDVVYTTPIGSRFCGTRDPRDSPDVVYTTLRTPTPTSQTRTKSPNDYSSSGNRTPLKTYYLGQEGTYQRLSPPKLESTPLRRVSAPVWKSTPTLNDPIFDATYKPRFMSRDETGRDARLRSSPVQRSVSQRDISPRQRLRSKVTAHDDGFIHKFDSKNFFDEEDNWLSSKTLPRGQKFTAEKPRHRTSYSEVQSFSTGGKKTDRSIQVELSDDEEGSQVFSSILSRARSPSPLEYEIHSLPRRTSTAKKSVLVGPNKNGGKFYFGNASTGTNTNKEDYRKLYGKSDGTTSRYSDGYGSLPSSKDRYHSTEKENSIDRRIASFNSYGKSDTSYDGSTITSDYTRNNRYVNDVRSEEKRKNSKNSSTNTRNSFDNRTYLDTRNEVDEGIRRKTSSNSSNERRHFIDSLLTAEEEPVYTRKIAPERRQRAMYSSSPPSPPRSTTPPSNSPPPRLIRADRFGGSSSLSPPDSPVAPPPPPPPPPSSGGTWNKKNIRSKSTGSPVVKMPNFTPLMSPLEIKNMANTINRSRSRDETRLYSDKYMDVKPGSKNGTVVVEVRDWGNR